MAIPDILINIATALDRVEAYIDGNTSFNPKNALNKIRILLTTARGLMQRNAQDAINMQGLYRIANDRINGLRNELTNIRNDSLQRERLLTLAYNNEVNERQRWWQIAQDRQTNAVAAFNAAARCQVMINKMTGRFAPVPANDPYAAGNPAINTEPLFLNWLREKYREVMVGTNRSAIFALVNEKFLETDTPDSYEKRIKPLVQAMPDADALPYLFNQLPSDLEMRVRIANPATVIAFFTDLRNIWHESAGKRIQAHTIAPVNYTAQPQKDDFKIRLARDLAYTGIGTDDATLENFIYEELKKRLGGQTAHVRKSPFTPRSAYATKKVVRKDEVEDPEDSEEEYIEEYIEDSEEEEVEEDDEYIDTDESRNCYAVKKKCNIDTAANYMFQIALKSSIASLVPHCPREILIEISKFINMIFPKIKDHCLNTSMPNDTVKRRESAWRIVASKFEDILFPLLQAVNSEQKPLLQVPDNESKIKEINTASSSYVIPESIRLDHAIKAYASAQKKNSHIYWPKPLEINFLQIKDADDVATISFSENVAKHLGLKIDKKKIHRLNGVASKSHSLGTVNSVPVTIEDGENRDTISDEFSVVPTEYDDNGKELSLFILGTQWQYRAGWKPLVKGEFKATQNGKTITIPLYLCSYCNKSNYQIRYVNILRDKALIYDQYNEKVIL
ncbi:hypothetical protein RclHR1_27010002 [Rhizophagus clarus]|uniref:Uncharacterized protein n=1 Tax=Rhizophagus clarus TaxID=94130 RepID=A0A2Z6R2N6_9GLOM|nr:hypothetical protein RclHR1_27010002 [Rhizophagus clarus]